MSHYQPLSWLAWRAFGVAFGDRARKSITSASLRRSRAQRGPGVPARRRRLFALAGLARRVACRLGALAAALLFGLHPLRVEVVAWASAFPYVLALAFLLVSVLFYLLRQTPRVAAGEPRPCALVAYAASLAEPPAGSRVSRCAPRPRRWRAGGPCGDRSSEKSRSRSRPRRRLPGVGRALLRPSRTGGPRAAALRRRSSAPFVYLLRAVAPVRPLAPRRAAPRSASRRGLALAGGRSPARRCASGRLALARRGIPGWSWRPGAYLALLAPALGLTPSGLQATADRYTYLPDVALALLAGAALSRRHSSRWRAPCSPGRPGASGRPRRPLDETGRASGRDSETLWTRGSRSSTLGTTWPPTTSRSPSRRPGTMRGPRPTSARPWTSFPTTRPARSRLVSLESQRWEREARPLAASGRLEDAVALREGAREGPRAHASHASRGMALAQLGRLDEAVRDLETAVRLGNDEPEIAGALAMALAETGRWARGAPHPRASARASSREIPDLAESLARLRARRSRSRGHARR